MSTESETFITGLDSLRVEYLEIDRQLDRSLASLYDFLRRIQVRSNKLERNHDLREKVVAKIGKRKNRNLTLTVLTYVIKPESRTDRQKASKYSRALEYLNRIEETEPANISEAIKKAGGIESLARKAAKELPKTKRPTSEKSDGTGEGTEIASAALEVETAGSRSTNRRTRNVVNLSIPSNLNKKLSGVPVDGKVKLICRRVEGEKEGIDLEITKIIAVHSPSD